MKKRLNLLTSTNVLYFTQNTLWNGYIIIIIPNIFYWNFNKHFFVPKTSGTDNSRRLQCSQYFHRITESLHILLGFPTGGCWIVNPLFGENCPICLDSPKGFGQLLCGCRQCSWGGEANDGKKPTD